MCLINELARFNKVRPGVGVTRAANRYWIPVFKSPQYTGGDFMFLYRFVRRRRRRPQILVHAITFWISFIFGTIVGPDL